MTLAPEHFEHLDNILNNGLLKKVVPSDAEAALLQSGYARKAVGGLMPTEAGHKAFMQHQKDVRHD